MFKSRWVFSIIFAASAIFILGALWVPTVIISLYNLSITLAILGVDPDVIFLTFEIVCSLSPGLILSGLYPQKKSLLNFNLENFSRTGTHCSSVQPGYTVDSYMIKSPFL